MPNGYMQDHPAIKRLVRPMLGFKDLDCAPPLTSSIRSPS